MIAEYWWSAEIARAMERKKMSLNDVSAASGVPYSTVYEMRRSTSVPTIVNLERVLAALGRKLKVVKS